MNRRHLISVVVSLFALLLLVNAAPMAKLPPVPAGMAVATFAGGCFWCTEHDLQILPGVIEVTSGFSGGTTRHPTYEEVSAGGSGHAESVRVIYDPTKISYAQLLDAFWHDIDPLDARGQFCDHGDQYRSVIFYHDAMQKKLAEESKRRVQARFSKPVVTQIVPAATFWPAEEYHQDYSEKNPLRYKYYRYNCGRDARLAELWK